MSLKDHPGSHFHASSNGWAWPSTWGEIAVMALSQGVINGFIRDEKKSPEPVVFPMPWDTAETEDPVSDDERERLRQALAERSAFAD